MLHFNVSHIGTTFEVRMIYNYEVDNTQFEIAHKGKPIFIIETSPDHWERVPHRWRLVWHDDTIPTGETIEEFGTAIDQYLA